jgi:hypothetical protein
VTPRRKLADRIKFLDEHKDTIALVIGFIAATVVWFAKIMGTI